MIELVRAQGILSAELSKLKDIPWTIIEPIPSPIEDCKANFLLGFFDENF